MLIDSILKLHDKIQHTKLGANRADEIEQQEREAMRAVPTHDQLGMLR
jgi:NADH-quinone oxidoreductase subunit B